MQIHHIQPLSKKGTHKWNNLIVICNDCHQRINRIDRDSFKELKSKLKFLSKKKKEVKVIAKGNKSGIKKQLE